MRRTVLLYSLPTLASASRGKGTSSQPAKMLSAKVVDSLNNNDASVTKIVAWPIIIESAIFSDLIDMTLIECQ